MIAYPLITLSVHLYLSYVRGLPSLILSRNDSLFFLPHCFISHYSIQILFPLLLFPILFLLFCFTNISLKHLDDFQINKSLFWHLHISFSLFLTISLYDRIFYLQELIKFCYLRHNRRCLFIKCYKVTLHAYEHNCLLKDAFHNHCIEYKKLGMDKQPMAR